MGQAYPCNSSGYYAMPVVFRSWLKVETFPDVCLLSVLCWAAAKPGIKGFYLGFAQGVTVDAHVVD